MRKARKLPCSADCIAGTGWGRGIESTHVVKACTKRGNPVRPEESPPFSFFFVTGDGSILSEELRGIPHLHLLSILGRFCGRRRRRRHGGHWFTGFFFSFLFPDRQRSLLEISPPRPHRGKKTNISTALPVCLDGLLAMPECVVWRNLIPEAGQLGGRKKERKKERRKK